MTDYYLCQTRYGEEIFGYSPNWQKHIDITPLGEKVVKDFTMSYSPSDTVVLDQTQGNSVLTTYLSTAPGGFGGGEGDKLWNMLYQSPFPIGMSGTCKPSTPSPTCAATSTCTYSSTTRVDSQHEYSTYTCDNGGTYRTPTHWYVGPTPYPSSRWYLAGVQISVPKNATTGGDTSCTADYNGMCGPDEGVAYYGCPSSGPTAFCENGGPYSNYQVLQSTFRWTCTGTGAYAGVSNTCIANREGCP